MVAPQMRDTRARLIRLFTFLGGVYFFLYFVLPEKAVRSIGMKDHHEQISNGFILIGVMALGLGLYNVVRAHGARCVFRRPGWFNSFVLLLGLIAMIGVTAAQWVETMRITADIRATQILGEFASRIAHDADAVTTPSGIPPLQDRVAALVRYGEGRFTAIEQVTTGAVASGTHLAGSALLIEVRDRLVVARDELRGIKGSLWSEMTADNREMLVRFSEDIARLASSYSILKRSHESHSMTQKAYDFMYDGLFNQLGSAMFALLGVYIAAAAYRAFRVRTVESGLMMTAAVVVMLGQISFGREIYEHMPSIRQWLLEVPNSAAFRAIRLGAGVAGLMLAIRMWLSIESKQVSSERK